MRLYNERALRYNQDHYTIEWDVEGIIDPDTTTITIYRSEVEGSPWTETASFTMGSTRHYFDFSVPPTNLHRVFYYKIKCEEGASSYESEPLSSYPVATPAALMIVRKNEVLLSKRVGIPSYVYVKRTWGTRCPKCYRGGAADSQCDLCYGTSFVGGYFDPIAVYVARAPEQRVSGRANGVPIETDRRRFWTSNYPLLREGDVIVDSRGERWIVLPGITVTDFKGFPLRQVFNASRRPNSDVIFKLEVPSLASLVPYRDNHIWRQEETPEEPFE